MNEKATDSEFLSWLADRLVHVYGENPNVDFVHATRRIAAASAAPVQVAPATQPLLWVSPEQAAAHTDLDDPKAGRYLPCRKTPAGKFTQPLYAAPRQPSPVADDARDATDDLWYLQDTRSYVGNDVLWWAKDSKGYTTDVSKAHAYTREQAFRQAAMRGCDRAWPKAYIDGKTRPAVDRQSINHSQAFASLAAKPAKEE